MRINWYQGLVRLTWVMASPGIIMFFLCLLAAAFNSKWQWLFWHKFKWFEVLTRFMDPYLILSLIGVAWFILLWLIFVCLRWVIQGFAKS